MGGDGCAVKRVFVGRSEELAVLEGARERARAGQPQRVLVEGPEGIGKTALVRRFLAGVPHVLYAEGEDAGTGPAFGVLEQLIGPGRWTDPGAAGAALVEALQKTLQKAGGVGEDAVTVVVDDAQWAGSASLSSTRWSPSSAGFSRGTCRMSPKSPSASGGSRRAAGAAICWDGATSPHRSAAAIWHQRTRP